MQRKKTSQFSFSAGCPATFHIRVTINWYNRVRKRQWKRQPPSYFAAFLLQVSRDFIKGDEKQSNLKSRNILAVVVSSN